MAFDVLGVFHRVYNWIDDRDSGIKIMASRMDEEFNNIAEALSNCITRDGYGKPNSTVSWNNQKLSNLAAGTFGTDAINLSQLNAVAARIVTYTLEQFGGAADWTPTNPAPTDNLPALNAAIAAAKRVALYYPNWPHTPEIRLNLGGYYFSDHVDLKTAVRIIGQGSGMDDFNGGSNWVVAAGKSAMTFNNTNTEAGGTGLMTTAATGSYVQGVTFRSLGGGVRFDGNNRSANTFGLWLRAPVILEDVDVDGFKGNGIQIIAAAGWGGSLEGNANGWLFKGRVTVKNPLGSHGIYVKGKDANMGYAEQIDVRQAGLCGYFEDDTLGNHIATIEVDDWSGAKADAIYGGCTYTGVQYLYVGTVAGDGAATVPGTNNGVWFPVDDNTPGAAFWPAWSGAGNYQLSMPIHIRGNSCTTRIDYAYSESGWSDISTAPAYCDGGQIRFTRRSPYANTTLQSSSARVSPRGFGFQANYVATHTAYAKTGSYLYSVKGGDPSSNLDSAVLDAFQRGKFDGSCHVRRISSAGNVVREVNGAARMPYYQELLEDTTWQCGRSVIQPYKMAFPGFFLGHDNDYTGAEHRWLGFKSAAPTAGEYAKGDTFFNTDAGPGIPFGWKCWVAGTPGTWVPFNIPPIQSYVASAALTGTTAETTMATINVPGNLLGPKGVLVLTTLWSATAVGGTKTQRAKFGGTTLWTGTMAANALGSYLGIVQIANRNATNSQIATPPTITSGYGQNNAAIVTTALDTTAVQQITVTGQLAVGTDTLTLEGYSVEFKPSA